MTRGSAKIVEISVGIPRTVWVDGRAVRTSIFKSPAAHPVYASHTNLEGDKQADLSVHGGRDKAIYVYSQDYYARWADDLGSKRLEPAQFGENLTVAGGTDTEITIGDVYQIGGCKVTVTQPRIPCFKLGIRFGDASIPKRFWERGELGFYLRVLTEGFIETGQDFILLERPGHRITIRSLWEIVSKRDANAARIALSALAHLDRGWKRRLAAIANLSKDD
jgi:MOSC domain-containing protein YiiM